MTDKFTVLDQPAVSRVLFYPRPDPADRPTPLRVRSVHIPVGPPPPLQVPAAGEGSEVGATVPISGRLYRAKLDGPSILFFHGNGELASDYDGISLLYTSLGINLLVVDYRGYGSSGGEPTASHLLADAVKIYEQTGSLLEEHELKAGPLFVMGRSLGSAAAIEVAVHAGDRIAGLIIESGFALTLPLLVTLGLRLGAEELVEAQDGFGNLDKITRVHVPTLIIHGEEDRLIPVESGRALFEHAGATAKRLVIIPNAGHNDLLFAGQRHYFEALRAFIFAKRNT